MGPARLGRPPLYTQDVRSAPHEAVTVRPVTALSVRRRRGAAVPAARRAAARPPLRASSAAPGRARCPGPGPRTAAAAARGSALTGPWALPLGGCAARPGWSRLADAAT